MPCIPIKKIDKHKIGSAYTIFVKYNMYEMLNQCKNNTKFLAKMRKIGYTIISEHMKKNKDDENIIYMLT